MLGTVLRAADICGAEQSQTKLLPHGASILGGGPYQEANEVDMVKLLSRLRNNKKKTNM